MKRDDYKVKDTMIFEESQEESINSIIDNIFDDFESRTCENCKYLDIDLICTNEDTPCCSEYSGRFDDFNCNKWEISK